MPEGASTSSGESSALLIWILHSTGAGANRQLLDMASALDAQHEVKYVLDPPLRAFLDRFTPGAHRRIPARKREALSPPWPDLVLIGGGRSLVDALRIRHASGGHSRIVCLGRPGAPFHWVDCIITTPQYRLPQHPRVLHLEMPLNHADPNACAEAGAAWRDRFAHLPRPWYGVLLGGDSGSYRFTTAAAAELGRELDALTAAGGSVLITTSPRTPPGVLETMLESIAAPHFCHRWQPGQSDNPLPAILGLADKFVVTADSASMLAEACSTGRPVAGFEPPLRWRARLAGRGRRPSPPGAATGMLARWRDALVVRGCWVPARDMGCIYHTLRDENRICTVDALGLRDHQHGFQREPFRAAVARLRELMLQPETPPAERNR